MIGWGKPVSALQARQLDANADLIPATDREGPHGLQEFLGVCRRLAGATAVSIVTVHEVTGAAQFVAEGDTGPVDLRSPAVRRVIEKETAVMFPGVGPRWTASTDDSNGATVVARVNGLGPEAYLLALSFADASPVLRARVARLLPELVTLVSTQVSLKNRVADADHRGALCAAALDDGECAVIAVREDHSVLFANVAASAMLAEADGIQIKRGLIKPTDYRQAARFEAALDAVQEGAGRERGDKARALVMLLPRRAGSRPLIVMVAPAPSGTAGVMHEAAALIYLLQPEPREGARGLDTVAELHGLTKVETRLLEHLCAGLTVAESAERMRIKLETARAYLKQIFAKTGTHRQTELVTLMTRYMRAIRGDFDFRPA